MNPTLSIFMPICLRPEYTKITLKSLADTTRHRKDIQYILVLDGDHTEETKDAIADFVGEFKDSTIVHEEQTHFGIRATTVTGMELSKGQFIQKIDNDLLFSDGWVEKMIKTLNKCPEIDVLKPNVRWGKKASISSNVQYGTILGNGYIISKFCQGGIWMIRRQTIEGHKFDKPRIRGRQRSNPLIDIPGLVYAWSTTVDFIHFGHRGGDHSLFINSKEHAEYYSWKAIAEMSKRSRQK